MESTVLSEPCALSRDQAWLGPPAIASLRLAPATRSLRAVHRLVLRSFAKTGAPPSLTLLAQAAAPFDATAVLSELAEDDYICLDRAGQVSAAYPFSATATPHRVKITGGATVYSMCAVDALGISFMLRTSARISSRDPVSSEPVTVLVDGDQSTWRPRAAVVFYGRTTEACAASVALTCCWSVNFFASEQSAASWAGAHPGVMGGVMSQAQALARGKHVFGRLLNE
jgi:Alkylmercury lyase